MLNLNQQFSLPGTIAVEQLLAELETKTELQTLGKQVYNRTFYDSFDRRLYDADLALAILQQGDALLLSLFVLQTGELLGAEEVAEIPVFAQDIGSEKLHKIVAAALEMRALLPILTESFSGYAYNITNKRRKIVGRLRIETSGKRTQVHLQALKGFAVAVSKWVPLLQQQFNLTPLHPAQQMDSLREELQRNGHYLHKLRFLLDPDMRADAAGKLILTRLLEVIENNEQGVIENIDSEFLHDLRVAVRKTRSALGQLKGIFPEAEVMKFRKFFSWLGQVTGPTRDMDVYLLSFAGYENSLPAAIRPDLQPLYGFLEKKHRQAHRELARHLQSSHYRKGLAVWKTFLAAEANDYASEPPNAATPVKAFAARRIWRIYRRVLRQGSAINDASPPEDMHELRKTCKKLRYLMEFFQSLFPAEEIAALIKVLKVFQEVLGNFQDYQVQEQHLKNFGEEMLAERVPASAFMAMGVLIQHLDELRRVARAEFAGHFAEFQNPAHQAAFAALFAPEE